MFYLVEIFRILSLGDSILNIIFRHLKTVSEQFLSLIYCP